MSAAQVIHLTGEAGLALSLMDMGATWLSCKVPLRDGRVREVVLGCQHPADYATQTAYLGATVGRYANRIAMARITRDGKHWDLAHTPDSPHQLHGGPMSFSHRQWMVINHTPSSVHFQLVSEDGDQGFPGRVVVDARCTVSGRDRVTFAYEARTSAPCPVGITNHAYFNLDGGTEDARRQTLQIHGSHYMPVDDTMIPYTDLQPVAGTDFDFRAPKTLLRDWMQSEQQRRALGYDHAYLLSSKDGPAAVLTSADQHLRLSVHTDAPALQLYTAQHLTGTRGRDGTPMAAYSGIALEPGFIADSPNHPEWPQADCWLRAGAVYRHTITYHFEALA
jgi:aldose 1-epimerase